MTSLYQLIPLIYRELDVAQKEPLRALLALLQVEYDEIERNIGDGYDAWFIESCPPWVVPYIAELLGTSGLQHGQNTVVPQRSRVADTIRFRRRKGTLDALQADVSEACGWPVRALPCLPRTAVTQNVAHVRPEHGGFVNTRAARAGATLPGPTIAGGPFDDGFHTVDVRGIRPASGLRPGLYQPKNVALWACRMRPFPVVGIDTWPLGAQRARALDAIGREIPVFTLPDADEAGGLRPADLPIAVDPAAFAQDLDDFRARYAAAPRAFVPDRSAYYGPGRSVQLLRTDGDGALVAVPPMDVVGMRILDPLAGPQPPAAVVVLRGGAPRRMPVHRARPELRVRTELVDRVIALPGPLDTLTEAAAALEAALAGVAEDPALAGASVVAADGRLVVVPGGRAHRLPSFEGTEADPETARDLGLRHAEAGGAVLSEPARAPTAGAPTLRLSRRAAASWDVTVFPGDPDAPSPVRELARRLQAGLEEVPDPTVARARVVAVGDRLLVLPPALDAVWRFGPTDADASTVEEMGLAERVGIDVERGIALFGLADALSWGEGRVVADRAYGRPWPVGAAPGRERTGAVGHPWAVHAGNPLAAVLAEWDRYAGATGVIRVATSATQRPTAASGFEILASTGMIARHLAIAAEPGEVACVVGDLRITGGQAESTVRLAGLLVRGDVVVDGPCRLVLERCTIEGAVRSSGQAPITVSIADSEVGALALGAAVATLAVGGSVVSGAVALSGALTATTSTFLGPVSAASCDAGDCIFAEPLTVSRPQEGAARRCYLAPGSRPPETRGHCVPPAGQSWRPVFVSITPGQPGYAQLAPSCPAPVRTGGRNGGEMGVFAPLRQNQRVDFALAAAGDYLPAGMAAGIFFLN